VPGPAPPAATVVEGGIVVVPVGGRLAVMTVVVVWVTEVTEAIEVAEATELDAAPGRH